MKRYRYDLNRLEAVAKKKAFCSDFLLILSILLLLVSTVLTVIWGDILYIFIICACLWIASLLAIYKAKKSRFRLKYKGFSGVIEKIDLKVGASNGIATVGYGGLVKKRYSKYFRDINRVILYIKSGDEIKLIELSDVSRTLENYYKVGDKIIGIAGSHFPIKENFADRWLCPFCGELNPLERPDCKGCGSPILEERASE